MDEKLLREIEEERHHSPTFVAEVRVPELVAEIRRLRALAPSPTCVCAMPLIDGEHRDYCPLFTP